MGRGKCKPLVEFAAQAGHHLPDAFCSSAAKFLGRRDTLVDTVHVVLGPSSDETSGTFAGLRSEQQSRAGSNRRRSQDCADRINSPHVNQSPSYLFTMRMR
jgi:hypothetical protein